MNIRLKTITTCVALALASSIAQAIDVLYIANQNGSDSTNGAASTEYSTFITTKYPGSNWVSKASGLTAVDTVGGDLDRMTDFTGLHGESGITVRTYLQRFDLIIIGLQVTSTNFVDNVSFGAKWASINKPILFHSSLAARGTGNRPGMFSGDNNTSYLFGPSQDTERVSTSALADAIFAGVSDSFDLYDGAALTTTDTISNLGDPGTGAEIITRMINNEVDPVTSARGIVFWNAGGKNGLGFTLAAKRAFLPLKNITVAPTPFGTLSADGEIVLGNLIDQLLVSSPVIFLPPSALTAKSAADTKINLTWTATDGAVSYKIKRSLTPGGPYTEVITSPATITTNSYTDSGLIDGTTYYYVVSAVNSTAVESADSNEASALAVTSILDGIDILYLSTANNTVYENLATNGQFANNTWTQKSLGTTGNNLIGGDLARLAEFTGVNGTTVGSPVALSDYLNSFDLIIIGTPTASANFVDSAEGAQWAALTVPVLVHSPFAARAFGGRMGLFSGDNTLNPFPFVNPAESLRVSVSPLSDAILAGVTDVTNLYSATQSDTINGTVRSPNAFGNGEEITRITDGTVEHRGVVFWAAGATLPVVPPDGLQLASNRAYLPYSGGPADLNADGQKVLINLIKQLQVAQTAPPALLTFPPNVLAEEATGDAYVSWGPAINAVKYNVKRSTTAGGPYTQVASGVTSEDYLDVNVTAGATYFYVVTSVSATETESPNSDEATVTLPGGGGFQSWIDGFTTQLPNEADRDPAADPDKDGSSNLIEFALNGNPADASNNGAIGSLIQNSSLTLIIAVRDGAVFNAGSATIDGIIYTVEGSLDLAFPGSPVSSTGPSDTAPPATGLPDLTGTAWEYHTFTLDASVNLPGKGFLRLKVMQP